MQKQEGQHEKGERGGDQLEVMRLVEQSDRELPSLPPPEPETFERIRAQVVHRRRWIAVGLVLAMLVILALARPWQQTQSLSEAELMKLARSRQGSVPQAPRDDAGNVAGERTSLRVSSAPLGATVYVDSDMAGVTPLWLEDLPSGRHTVEVRMAGYAPLDTVVSLGGDSERLYLLMKPSAELSGLRSNEVTVPPHTPPETPSDPPADPPSQAEAEAPVREAPEREAEPEEDPDEDSPRAATDTPSQESEDIEDQVSEELGRRAGGILSVTSEPAGAAILIDGSRVGETPAMLRNIREGERDVTIQLTGYDPATVSVRVRTGETSRIHRELSSSAGTLLVLVKPWGSIYIDGALHVENTDIQYRTKLSEGTHWVRAVHPVLGAHEEVVNVTAQSPVELVFDLNQGARSIESEAAPEAGGGSDKASVPDVGGVYIVAEVPPQLIGGLDALQRQVQYPEAAARARLQGRVYMRLVVDENGEVNDPVVTRGLCPECDREALRVAHLARFRPAEVGGKPVPAWYNLYLNFRGTD